MANRCLSATTYCKDVPQTPALCSCDHTTLYNMEERDKLSILIILFVAFLKAADCQEMQSLYVCEHNTLTISCGDDEFIKIHDALYGRKSSSICSGTNAERSSDCEAENSVQIVKNECENKTKCAIRASNEVFGDPCVGIFKYLAVTYTCEVRYTCPHDVININGIKLTFNAAKTDEEVDSVETCPMGSSYPNRPLATRLCTESWQEPMLTECYNPDTLENQLQELAEMNVTDENVEEVAAMLALVSSQTDDITTDGLENLIVTLDSVVQVGSPSFEVSDSVVGSVNNIMKLDEEMLAETPDVSDTVQLLEIELFNVHQSGQNYTQVDPYLGVSALKLDDGLFEQDYTFTDHFTTADRNGLYSEGNTTHSSITLPSSIVSETRKVYPNVSIIPVSFISYLESSLFQTNNDVIVTEKANDPGSLLKEYIDSHVIAATVELEDVVISNLPPNSSVITRFSTPILTFDLNETNTTVDFVCVFWVQPSKGSYGQWSTEGCKKVPSESEEDVICSCNHLTSFAVLVRVYDTTIDNEKFLLALDIISMIGCVISIIGLSFSVIAMLMIRAVRQKQQTHVHFNLCLALLGLYLSFLLGIDQAEHPGVCRAMTSLIYFFCLSSMAWMSVEAFYIYMLIWKYKRSSIRHLILIAIILAWGLPAVAILLVAFLDNSHDYTNDQDYCFLHPGPTLYFGFLLEIFCLFLYNLTVFVLATYRISCRKIKFANKSDKREELLTRLKSTFLFWILLGMCWIFGFLATFQSPASLAFQVLFCICLSLQGFFMFFMLFVQNPEMKKSLTGRSSQTTTSSALANGNRSTNYKKNDYLDEQSVDMQTNPVSSLSNLYEVQ